MRRKANALGYTFKPLTAWEALNCIKEAAGLAREFDGMKDAGFVCFNACLAAQCLYQKGKRPFADGREALSTLSLAQLAEAAQHYVSLFGAGQSGAVWRDPVKGVPAPDEEAEE